jgi:hypothetical protein
MIVKDNQFSQNKDIASLVTTTDNHGLQDTITSSLYHQTTDQNPTNITSPDYTSQKVVK